MWQLVEELLLVEKQRIANEIAFYPPPIPACDAQFNYLLEQRAEIAEALWQWRQLAAAAAVEEVEGFLTAVSCISPHTRTALLASLN
ncbi:MAG: hypothetical protein R3C62_08275 [Chloroflexota bacterium]